MRANAKITMRTPGACAFAITAMAIAMSVSVSAAVPVALWDGAVEDYDFMSLTRTLDGVTYTLNLNSQNAVKGNGSYVQIGPNDTQKAITLTADNAGAFGTSGQITVIMKCSALNLADNTFRGLIGLISDEGGYYSGDNNVKVGVATGHNGTYGAGAYTHYIANGVFNSNSANTTAYTTGEQTICMAYNSASGTYIYRDGSLIASSTSVKYGTWLSPVGLVFGGMDLDGSSRVYAQTGMKIHAIAVFSSMLGAEEVAAYNFPSESIPMSGSVKVSDINARFGTKSGINVYLADGATVTGDTTFNASSVNFVCNGSFTIAPPAGNTATFDFSRVTGKPVVQYSAFPTVSGSVFTSTTVPTFVTDSAKWSGVIYISGGTFTDFTSNAFGNESSLVRLGNVSGWLRAPGNYAFTNSVPVELVGVLTINNGNSANDSNPNRCTVFRKLSGNGYIFGGTSTDGDKSVIVIQDASEFTGNIGLQYKIVVFGDSMPSYTDNNKFNDAKGSIWVMESASVTANPASDNWWALKGIKVYGELRAPDLGKFGDGTSINACATGTLVLTGNGTKDAQEFSTDFARVRGDGTVKYTNGNSAYWRGIPTNNFTSTLALEIDVAGGMVVPDGDVVIGSLIGTNATTARLFSNYGAGKSRTLRICEARDTEYAGVFSGDDRIATVYVQGGSDSAGTLKLSGTQTQNNALVVESDGSVNLTGTWAGPVSVSGTFGGTGTVNGNLALSGTVTLKVADGDHPLTVRGNISGDEAIVSVDFPVGTDIGDWNTFMTTDGNTDFDKVIFFVSVGGIRPNGCRHRYRNDGGRLQMKVTPLPAYGILSSSIAGFEGWWNWTVPGDANVDEVNGVVSAALNGTAIEQSLGNLVTNAVAASVLAEVPADGEGALIGLCLSNDSATNSVYAYVDGGVFTIYYDEGAGMTNKTASSKPSSARDLSHVHLWTLACTYDGGFRLYEDGQEIASDVGIKWTRNPARKPSVGIAVGNDVGGRHPLAGVKVYRVNTDAANDISIIGKVAEAYADLVAAAPSVEGVADKTTRAAILDNYVKYGITTETVKINGTRRSFAESAPIIQLFGLPAIEDEGVTFGIGGIDMSDGTIRLNVAPSVLAGNSLSVFGKAELGDRWRRLKVNPEGSSVSIYDEGLADCRFFQIRAEFGGQTSGYPVSERQSTGDPENTKTKSYFTSSTVGGDTVLFSISLDGGCDGDYQADCYKSLSFSLSGVAAGATATLATNGVVVTSSKVGDNGSVAFNGMPLLGNDLTVSLGISTSSADGRTSTTNLGEKAGVLSYTWGDSGENTFDGGVTNVCTLLAKSPYCDGLGNDINGVFRIPAIAKATNNLIVAVYDCRYKSGADLGSWDESKKESRWPINIAGNISADGGLTWSRPSLQGEIPVSYDFASGTFTALDKDVNFGDPCILYDPAFHKFWMMGITGGGISSHHSGSTALSDVVLYSRGGEAGDVWGNRRSIKSEVLAALAKVDSSLHYDESDQNFKGIFQGPGHGIVQRHDATNALGAIIMPKGTLVFPMQYFYSSTDLTYCFAIYSKDNAQTWQATKLTPSSGLDGMECYAQEGCVVELDDGSWVQMAKNGNANVDATTYRHFFRTTDFTNWTHCATIYPSCRCQGSCLRIGTAAADGKSRYVACFAAKGDYYNGRRGMLTLYFGRDTSEDPTGPGIEWDCGETLIWPEMMGGYAYNSLVMLDDYTLGILFETEYGGHIYLRKVDVSAFLNE